VNTRNQLFAIHMVIPFVLCTVIGAFIMPGWLPPPDPNMSLDEVARTFNPGNHSMRLGAMLVAAGSATYIGLGCAINTQLKRAEGPFHCMANVQMLGAAIGVLAVQFPAYFWLAASYRDTVSPEISAVFNNLAFFMIIGAFSPAVVQNVAIAVAILGADEDAQKPYPRWIAYANLWLAIALLPGAALPFFKEGPLTYRGVIGFWVVVVGFFAWVIMMWWWTVKAIKEHARTGSPQSAFA
jgi:hypothetical protein